MFAGASGKLDFRVEVEGLVLAMATRVSQVSAMTSRPYTILYMETAEPEHYA
jgi:hypothetical protein